MEEQHHRRRFKMKCNHVQKDAPENVQCEDCGTGNNLEGIDYENPDYPKWIKAERRYKNG